MRFIIGIPILFSVAAFVLAMLALFAGNKPGFMEDYHIIMVGAPDNTPGLVMHDICILD